MADAGRLGSRTRSAVFAPIGELGRAAGVEKRLGEAIRAGVLVDGERLPSETELAARLGVATVTAREALVALRSHGLVTTVRGRAGGSFVVAPSLDAEVDRQRWLASMTRVELADRGVHYATILAGCAELATERATVDDVADLHGIIREPGATDGPADGAADVGAWRQADTEMHLALATLTGSARLSREVMRLEADFGVLLRLPLAAEAHRTLLRRHQEQLLEAVVSGDAAAARSRMRDRVRSALGDLAELHAGVR